MTVAEGGGIFVSYRRQETSHLAGRLADRLADRFGESQVFIDVDTIEPGVDFAEEISRAVTSCEVLLAIIGPAWLTATDERGRRRLDDPDDIVRLEIEAALARNVRVIPILVEGAAMPGRQDLPDTLAGLARRNALFIRHESFRSDAGRLVTAIERVLAKTPGAAVVSGILDASGQPARAAVGAVPQRGLVPSPRDLAWAARLLTDAERAAHFIDVEATKVSMLSEAAKAATAFDPDRAARIITDAERIARSITYEFSKGNALSDVAGALAASDPDRAERIASSITDGASKARALGAVAAARATGYRDRAERIANSITDEFYKARALSLIGKAVAAADPDRATRITTDAERTARSITDGKAKASALGSVVWAVATIDPDRAERIANSITDESSKAYALGGVAAELAATDLGRAARLFTEAERIALSIADESSKAYALGGVARKAATIDPGRAERIAQSIYRGVREGVGAGRYRGDVGLHLVSLKAEGRRFDPVPDQPPSTSHSSESTVSLGTGLSCTR